MSGRVGSAAVKCPSVSGSELPPGKGQWSPYRRFHLVPAYVALPRLGYKRGQAEPVQIFSLPFVFL